jgi:hypothetical protein
MMDENEIIEIYPYLDEPEKFITKFIVPSKDKKKKKKKKKYIKNFLGEYVEVEDEYECEYDVLRYPPGSNPPSYDNKLTLGSRFMITNKTL